MRRVINVATLAVALLACAQDDGSSGDAGREVAANTDAPALVVGAATAPTLVPIEAVDPVVAENVVVIDDRLEIVSSSDGEVIVTGDASDLAAGDIVVSGTGSGFAGLITAIEPDGERTTLSVSPVGIGDVFTEVGIEWQQPLDLSTFSLAPGPGVDIGSASAKAAGDGLPCPDGVFRIPFSVSLYDGPEGSATLDGCVSLAVEIDYAFQQSFFWFNLLRLVPHLKADGFARLTSNVALTYPDTNYELFRLTGAPVSIPVAGVPVVITPSVQVSALISGDMNGAADIRLGVGTDIFGGVEYVQGRDPEWTFPAAASLAHDFDAFGALDAHARFIPIRASLELEFWGTLGIYTTLNVPTISLTFDASADGQSARAVATGRVTLDAGLYAETAGHTWVSQAWGAIAATDEVTIFDATLGRIAGYRALSAEDGTAAGFLGGRAYTATAPDEGGARAYRGSLRCAYTRDFEHPAAVDSGYEETYDFDLSVPEGPPTHLVVCDEFGRPYLPIERARSGETVSEVVSVTAGSATRDTSFDYAGLTGTSGSARVLMRWRGDLVAEADLTMSYAVTGDTASVTVNVSFTDRTLTGEGYTSVAVCTGQLTKR